MMVGGKAITLASMASILAMITAEPALAQAAAASPDAAIAGDAPQNSDGDILVLARKRVESILKVPVVVTALPQATLERLQVTDIADLPKMVPGLNLGQSVLSIGMLVAMRGIGTTSADPGIDQSISLNIDGLSLSHGAAFQSGLFDLQQIEVLKGPQALFYGKSSPAGVIALRTADPTDTVEVIGRAGYEFEGREARGELILSGPIGETLKARLAGMYAHGQGYFYNHSQGIAALGGMSANTSNHRETQPRNAILRGTLLWNPSSSFSAKLKANYVYDHLTDAETEQYANCPGGAQVFTMPGVGAVPFVANEDCRMDRELNIAYLNPANYPGITNNGVPFIRNRQYYGTLDLNYDLTPDLALTSTTGFYKLQSDSMVNSFHTTAAGPTLATLNDFNRREFTEELRLNSDFSGPLNVTLGGFYQSARIFDHVRFIGNSAYPSFAGVLRDGATTVKIETWSLFGQLRYKLTDTLELSGGARWTDETRRESLFNFVTNTDYTNTLAAGQTALPPRRLHASNVAPEVTLNYTPTDDLTLFASYKKGYKSGSFSIATFPAPGGNNAFGDESVSGGEAGLKARLAGGAVRVNLAGYDYLYKGLQVGAIEPPLPGGLPVIRVINAGEARTYGLDFDVSYRPPTVEGLGLNFAVNWNHGRYRKFDNIPCYTGQQVSQGCNTFFVASANQVAPGPTGAVLDLATGKYGFYTGQNLSGTPLIRAPAWQATFGFDYQFPIGSGLKLAIANSNQYQSRYAVFLAVGRPGNDNFEPSFLKSDLSFSLKDENDRWEAALIGKNIGDKITSSNCTATNFDGGTFLGAPITGGTQSGPAGYAEKACFTERGRSIWLRLTFRPFN